jgi:hypothetical protein
VLVNALAPAQTQIVSLLLARWLLPKLGLVEGVEAVAHAVDAAVPVLTGYVGHRYATFE